MYFGPSQPYPTMTPYMRAHLQETYLARPLSSDPDFSSYSSFLPQLSDSYAIPEEKGANHSYLEALTEGLDSPTRSDPVGDFFSGKRLFLAKSVEDILGSIFEREQIKYENILKIDHESCKHGSLLLQMRELRPGINPTIDKARNNIERELSNLEREKRFEEVACWRDMTRLKGDLREVMKEFAQEKRREALITGKE